MKESIKLGVEAKDTITGFAGIVICITDWLNGCRRITIQPQALHDGKPVEAQTFDVEQIEYVGKGVLPLDRKPTGGPSIPPVQRRDPK